jgi:hypothetical protein
VHHAFFLFVLENKPSSCHFDCWFLDQFLFSVMEQSHHGSPCSTVLASVIVPNWCPSMLLSDSWQNFSG